MSFAVTVLVVVTVFAVVSSLIIWPTLGAVLAGLIIFGLMWAAIHFTLDLV